MSTLYVTLELKQITPKININSRKDISINIQVEIRNFDAWKNIERPTAQW